MARLYPPRVHDETPYSEEKLFQRFANEAGTEDWIVLHSLGLASTATKPYGEIDFVVMIPGKGIVCLEIKGGIVASSDGEWTTTNRKTGQTSRLPKSPFMQARDGMYALKNKLPDLLESGDPALKCLFSFAAVFPDVSGVPTGTEADEWESIDRDKLHDQPLVNLLHRNLNQTAAKANRKPGGESATTNALERIRNAIRPDFERVVSRSTQIRESEEKLLALSPGQYQVLDYLAVNPHGLVYGPAGTGKTLLALEQAQRDAAGGRRVLFLCFNRHLGRWLGEEIERRNLGEHVWAGTFHSFLREVITHSSLEQDFQEESSAADAKELFGRLFPEYGELAMAEIEPWVDTLIVDEAQDLAKSDTLRILDNTVKGGLADGRWFFLGDFTRQAIFDADGAVSDQEDFSSLLQDYTANIPLLPLTENCRNSRPIAVQTALFSGFDDLPYRTFRVGGVPVAMWFWDDPDEEIHKLRQVLDELEGEDRLDPRDVVLLSPKRLENTAAGALAGSPQPCIEDLREGRGPHKGCFPFSTIQAFKGLESTAVVLCGVERLDTEHERSLLYTGMTRARSRLVLMLNSGIREQVAAMMQKQIEKGWAE